MRRTASRAAMALTALALAGAAMAQSDAKVSECSASASARAETSTVASTMAVVAASQSADGLADTFALLSERVGPTVVAVRSILEAPLPALGESPDSEGAVSEILVPPAPVVRSGSGFIVDARGWIVTSANLVAGGGRIEVLFGDDTIARAVSVYYDPTTGVAVVRIETGERSLTAFPVADGPDVVLGTPVYVVGPARGDMESPLISPGVVGAVGLPVCMDAGHRMPKHTPMLWTTCPMMTANPGAPVVDGEGHPVGVVVATPRGMSDMGGTLAAPIATARALLEGVRAKMSRPRAWLGVYLDDLPEDVRPGGAALVTGLYPDGPAQQAGVAAGDCIIAMRLTGDGAAKTVTIGDVRDLVAFVQHLEPGATIVLDIERKGEEAVLSLPVTVGSLPLEPPAVGGGAAESFGAEFADVPPERLPLFNVPGGAVLTRVERDGSAWAMGLRAGDVIVRVDSMPIESAADGEDGGAGATPGDRVTVEFRRLEEGTNKLASYLLTGQW